MIDLAEFQELIKLSLDAKPEVIIHEYFDEFDDYYDEVVFNYGSFSIFFTHGYYITKIVIFKFFKDKVIEFTGSYPMQDIIKPYIEKYTAQTREDHYKRRAAEDKYALEQLRSLITKELKKL